ncbi:LysR family transcriptional regulator [Buttiauxella sp.]|uniref:LysR family transcriptional regulator n=1 Tax=Buttiauxella sp. TaxID=1972222 RepID=UPI003C7739D9
MDLKRLRYFCKVVEHGSITQAAKMLNMAQPPLSKRIRELEEELDVTLFERNGSRIEPTQAGYHLYRRACEILRQVEDAALETRQINSKDGKVLRIGLSHLFQRWFQPLLLALHRAHPNVELNISVLDSSHLEEKLNDGMLDVALIQRPYCTEGYDIVAFEPVKLVAVISKKLLPTLPDSALPFLELANFPLILLHRARDTGTYEILLELFRNGGVMPNVIMQITQPGAILDWLEAGFEAATLLPASEVNPTQLTRCHVVEIFPAPQIFFPAMVKMTVTPYIPELMEILSEGYPFQSTL